VSAGYRAIQWSPGKRVYDGTLAALLMLYLAAFLGATFVVRPEITAETALLRAFGTAALLLLHLVLAIGPLARLDRRFLPLLWNRRHLGVTMFLCALAHGCSRSCSTTRWATAIRSFRCWSPNGSYAGIAGFPFQPLGARGAR
jgi:methionine sulfoxide reductase heme-binding subunit